MDPAKARDLLARERERVETALSRLNRDGPQESDENLEPGDVDTENLYQDEYDEGRRKELETDLAALERAERRLAEGTYGLSVVSGEPIPEARLEALPTAERTVEEEERFRRS